MTPVALGAGWYIGWAVGLVVVLVAAALLLIVIGLGRRIVRQATDITTALEGTHRNTDALWDVRATNHAIDRVTRCLAAAREMLTR
jgi:hypothetical protein